MNRHIPLIANTLLGIVLVSGCATANNTPTWNNAANTASKTTSVQSHTTKTSTTNTALVKQSTPTTASTTGKRALPTKPDTYTAQPEWVTNQLVYVIGWNKNTNPTKALFVSQNAGQSWTKVSTPLGSNVQQVHFQTPNTGIVYGATGKEFNHLAMYRTSDGGTHWTKESLPAKLVQGSAQYGAPDVTFVTLDHKLTWLMATWNDNQFPRHALYHSDNDGATWTYANNNSSISAEGYLSNFYAPDNRTAYFVSFCEQCAVSGQSDMTGTNTLEITHDSGRSWTKIALPFAGENRVKKLVFADDKHGSATVDNVTSGKMAYYSTNDGGHHWSKR